MKRLENGKPTMKQILDVQINCWRDHYNRNRLYNDKTSGYKHMPDEIMVCQQTWDEVVEEFLGIMNCGAGDSEPVNDPNAVSVSIDNYCGIKVLIRNNVIKGEFIIR